MPITVEKAVRIEFIIDKFLKAVESKERILRNRAKLIEENYKYYLPKIRAWMNFTNNEIIKALNQKYVSKSVKLQKDEAIDITTELLDWETLNENGKRMLKPASLDIVAKSGNEAYKVAGIEASFDILNPEAVKIVDNICSKLVTQVTDETKLAINAVIREGIQEGKSMGKVAKELKSLVGLTEKQVGAVRKYEDWLLKNRPDLSDLKRAQWVERYNKQLLNYRTDMIARTESMRATNEGNLIGYKEAGYKTVQWSANAGACDQCSAENGHIYTIEQSQGMLPFHPSCRCSWLPDSKEMPEEVLRREHLPSDLSESEYTNQFIEDARLQGKVFTKGEAKEVCHSVKQFTGGVYGDIRSYQANPAAFMEHYKTDLYKIKRAQTSSANLETYLKYSQRFKEQKIYRGIDLTSKEVAMLKKGQVIDMMGTSSFSSDPLTAARYGNAQFIVKNKTGVSVKHLSYSSGENEVILSKAAKFKITKITEGPKGIFDIYVEEVITKVPKVPKVSG